jgi:hypothetical protein
MLLAGAVYRVMVWRLATVHRPYRRQRCSDSETGPAPGERSGRAATTDGSPARFARAGVTLPRIRFRGSHIRRRRVSPLPLLIGLVLLIPSKFRRRLTRPRRSTTFPGESATGRAWCALSWRPVRRSRRTERGRMPHRAGSEQLVSTRWTQSPCGQSRAVEGGIARKVKPAAPTASQASGPRPRCRRRPIGRHAAPLRQPSSAPVGTRVMPYERVDADSSSAVPENSPHMAWRLSPDRRRCSAYTLTTPRAFRSLISWQQRRLIGRLVSCGDGETVVFRSRASRQVLA